jgi:hypothetical protein
LNLLGWERFWPCISCHYFYVFYNNSPKNANATDGPTWFHPKGAAPLPVGASGNKTAWGRLLQRQMGLVVAMELVASNEPGRAAEHRVVGAHALLIGHNAQEGGIRVDLNECEN